MKFFKYHSLSNDFIIIESPKLPSSLFTSAQIQFLCNRRRGIGADGILILELYSSLPRITIFNADGSNGEVCLNGARCIALHLYNLHAFPRTFKLSIHSMILECVIEKNNEITLSIPHPRYCRKQTLIHSQQTINGHIVDAGNPHFVIQKPISQEELEYLGPFIESHSLFPHKTNVEYIWPTEGSNTFHMQVYERGCGITQACSSGAIASLKVLEQENFIQKNEKIRLYMPGGNLEGIVQESSILLRGRASYIFEGTLAASF